MCWLFLEASDLAPAEGQAYRSMHYAAVKDAYSVQRCVKETLRLYEVRPSADSADHKAVEALTRHQALALLYFMRSHDNEALPHSNSMTLAAKCPFSGEG